MNRRPRRVKKRVRFYPDVPARRTATLLRDAVVLALLALFAWLALKVHDAVAALAVLGEGVGATGRAVEGGFDAAAGAVDGTPVVGDELAEGLRDAGGATGGEVSELGREGEAKVHRLADLLGILTFAIPTTLVLWQAVPGRLAQIRRLTASARVLEPAASDERRRLVAMRAAFSLPYGQLLEHTRDPLGDLAAERYDALVAAALDDAGLRPRAPARAE